MKIIILSICVFIMLRNTFSLSSNILFPIPKHKGPLFFNFQSIGNGRRKSKQMPSSVFSGCWKFIPESWSREEGNGDVCRMGMTPWWGGGWRREVTRSQVCSRMENGAKILQWVMGTPGGGSSSGGNTERTLQVQSTKHPLYLWKESKESGKSKASNEKVEPGAACGTQGRALSQDGLSQGFCQRMGQALKEKPPPWSFQMWLHHTV